MGKNHELKKVFIDELYDIYDAEHKFSKIIPTLISAAHSRELKEALQKHLKETKEQISRLDKIFSHLNISALKEECEVAKGLVSECEKAIQAYPEPELRDIAIIAKAQRIEHYEIAVYGTLLAFAKELDFSDIAKLLKESLGEEGKADKKLSKVAEGGLFSCGVNKECAKCK